MSLKLRQINLVWVAEQQIKFKNLMINKFLFLTILCDNADMSSARNVIKTFPPNIQGFRTLQV